MESASVDVPHVAINEQLQPRRAFVVSAERIRDYARAVGNDDRIHRDAAAATARGFDALVAPPTFATMVWMRAEEETLAAMVPGFHVGRILHADRTLDIVRPLLAGDRVHCDVHFESFRHYRDYDVVAMVTTLRDHREHIVTIGSSTLLVHTQRGYPRGAGPDGYARGLELATARHHSAVADRGEVAPDGHLRVVGDDRPVAVPDADPCVARPERSGAVHDGDRSAIPEDDGLVPVPRDDRCAAVSDADPCVATPAARPLVACAELRVGRELPVRHHRLAPADVMAHASVVGVPRGLIATDDDRAVPPVGATPGMLSLGLTAGYLSSWLADPTAVTRYRVQYAPKMHYLPVGVEPTSIEFRGRVSWLDPVHRAATVVIEPTAKGRKLFGYATAEIRVA